MAVLTLYNILSALVSLYQLNCLLMHRTAYLIKKKICHVALSGRNPGKVSNRKGHPKSCWIRTGRTEVWWDNLMNDVMVSQEWKENFRMSKENFLKLCDELHPYIQKKSTNMGSSIFSHWRPRLPVVTISDERIR